MASKDPTSSFGPENQKRLLQTLFFMPNTDLEFIRGIIEKLPNRWTEYPEILAWAIIANKRDVAEFLISDGTNLEDPPTSLSYETYGIAAEFVEVLKNYRKTPFLILAASRGSVEMVEMLLGKGVNMKQLGFVGTSKAKLNAVVSNVLGAAVFHVRADLVHWLISHFSAQDLGLELPTLEEKGIGKTLSKEYFGCTPFLLAVHRCDSPEILSDLINAGANVTIADWQQNNALHLAAAQHKTELVKFLNTVEGLPKRNRNGKGDTAFSIAKQKGFKDVLDALEDANDDDSAREAEELMKQLGAEEEKKTKKKKRKNPTQTKPALNPVQPVSIEPVLQSVTISHVSQTVPVTAVQVNPSSQDPVPSVTPIIVPETSIPIPVSTIPTEELKTVSPAPNPHKQAFSIALQALAQALAGKTQFDTLSKDELLTLQQSLEVALTEVTEVLNSR